MSWTLIFCVHNNIFHMHNIIIISMRFIILCTMIFFLDLTYAYSNSNLIKRKAIFVHEKLYSYGGHQKHHHNSLDRSNDTQVNTDFKSWNLRPAHERHHHRLRVVSTSFLHVLFLIYRGEFQILILKGRGSIFMMY